MTCDLQKKPAGPRTIAIKIVDNYTHVIIRSLSNHDDDGNKNPTNLHIWRWKTVFLHALHVHIFTFCRRSRSFYDVTWPVLQLRGRREHMTNFHFVFLFPKHWFQFNSGIVITHFYDGPQGTRCKQKTIAANKKDALQTKNAVAKWPVNRSTLHFYDGPQGTRCKQKTIAANKKDALQTKNDRCKQKRCAANTKRCGYMADNRSRFSKY